MSLHHRAGIGGLEGRTLRAGDRLPLGHVGAFRTRACPPGASRAQDGPIRVVLGPQDDHFTAAGIATLVGSEYAISDQADRMGMRLAGPAIEHSAKGFNIVSDGIPTGGMQVPGNGLPLILLADRQTTGGYPKIATVISWDLPRLVQSRPGTRLRFARSSGQKPCASPGLPMPSFVRWLPRCARPVSLAWTAASCCRSIWSTAWSTRAGRRVARTDYPRMTSIRSP